MVVHDEKTGLWWTKEIAAGKTWQQALAYCEGLDYGEVDNWRLPNINELLSLVDRSLDDPASGFPGIPSDAFWTSTTVDAAPTTAWQVDFLYSETIPAIKTGTAAVICVR